ncbi:MAG: HAD hydrolase family protein, partial [Alphaproteobacteria bacterium]|nr:HAD hydrolase family protein [Alphaproteobacteria bacterium]
RLILVSGRELPDLKRACSALEIFDRVVVENGAVIYDPATQAERVIGAAPPRAFIERLEARHVAPLSVGRSIVATWEPHGAAVLEVIRELGLDLQIIFNKGAVMVLPASINKAAGLTAALRELELSPHNVVAVGDAENDLAFLHACGCSAAVANALPMVRDAADINLAAERGAAVTELMQRICLEDGRLAPPPRHGIRLGALDDRDVLLEPYRGCVLIAGTSGIGKSTLATALSEHMAEQGFTFCVFDPEGDYTEIDDAVSVGDAENPPSAHEALELIRLTGTNIVVDTQNLDIKERPRFFAALLPQIAALQARTGRPHWLLVDEAHHLLPAARDVAPILPESVPPAILITVHPDAVSASVLQRVGTVIALGEHAKDVIAAFCRAIGIAMPRVSPSPGDDEVLVWIRDRETPPFTMKPIQPKQRHKRHTRKYSEGELGEDISFYFRGADDELNLRAQNPMLFLQIGQGVDDRTWLHHLRHGDYSAWFRTIIKNDELADEAAAVEADESLGADESRRRIVDAVTRRYTAPASASDR